MVAPVTLGGVPAPIQEPIVDPRTGILTNSWLNYFVRMPLTLGNTDTRLDTAEIAIVVVQGDVTAAEADILALQNTQDDTPLRLNTVELATQAASITATDFSGGTLAAGLYLAMYYARITQAAAVSSSLVVTIGWTDGAVAQSFVGAAIIGNTTATSQSGTVLLRSDAAAQVTYATTYGSVGAPSMQYSLDLVLIKVDA